jgi:hypothetical protein
MLARHLCRRDDAMAADPGEDVDVSRSVTCRPLRLGTRRRRPGTAPCWPIAVSARPDWSHQLTRCN